MKIAVAQLNSNDDVESNLKQIVNLISSAGSEKPRVIFFPENSLYFRLNASSNLESVSLNDTYIQELKSVCLHNKTNIHLTTAVSDAGQIYNATIWIDELGRAELIYKKIHLFDIELEGQKPIRESDVFAYGKEPSITDIDALSIGNSICYDIRFAELYSVYARKEVDIIAVPAAFLVKTGQAHWEVLLRARAIESQCYIVAPAQAGVHRSARGSADQRETYGNSMIVNPWGEICALKTAEPGLIFAQIDREIIRNTRKQIPMKNHRRIDF